MAEFSVGQVAKRCGVKVSALHFYEEKGLIKSWRNQGNQRRYSGDVIRRVAIIKAAQKVGVSLADIRNAFDSLPNKRTPDKDDWEALSKVWQAELNERISYMERLRDLLGGCIGCGCLSMKNCPMYNPDDIIASRGEGAVFIEQGYDTK